MNESISAPPADDAGTFELGEILGQRRAFSAVAGRCSAADAACLQRMRDRKLYLHRSPTWEEFCPAHLGMSKTQANRIIRNLEELGPDYFELAQLTRITAEEFRAIAPAVREKAIHVNGDAIALIPENSGKVAEAVAGLRRAAAAPEPSVAQRREAAGRRFDRVAAEFTALIEVSQGNDLLMLQSTLQRVWVELGKVLSDADVRLRM